MNRTLFIITLLTIPIILSPFVTAAHTTPWTAPEIEIAYQIDVGAAAGPACGTSDVTASLTAGTKYLIVTGFTTAAGNNFIVGSITGNIVQMNNGGTITVVASSWSPVLIRYMTGGGGSQAWAIQVTPPSTQTLTVTCTSGAFQNGWTPTLTCSVFYSCIGAITELGSNIGMIFNFDAVIQAEATILAGQTSKTPATSKFTWTRLNVENPLFAQTPSSTTQLANAEVAQSFTAASTIGKYLETAYFRLQATGACTGTSSVTISQSLTSPWTTSNEIANITFPTTVTTGPTGSQFIFNFVTGIVTGSSEIIPGTTTLSIGGTPVTTLANFPPAILSGTYYIRFVTDCSTLKVAQASSATYTGGTVRLYTGTWTEDATKDFALFWLNAYGGRQLDWQLNATARHLGGASYNYLAELQYDSNVGQAKPTTSYGGSAINSGLYQLTAGAGSAECIQLGNALLPCQLTEYRLGYIPLPLNSTQTHTITLDPTLSQRNLYFTGTLVNQPSQPNIALTAFDNQAGTNPDLTTYTFLSSDEYFANVTIQVKECLSNITSQGTCSSVGNALASTSYIVTLPGRTITGTANSTGNFTILGQDLINGMDVTLSLTLYQTKTYTLSIPTGYSNITLYLQKASSGSVIVETNIVTIHPKPGTFIVPDPAQFIINKTFPETVYWAIFKVQASGLPTIQTQAYPITKTSDTARYPISGPSIGTTGVSNHTGQYYIPVTDENGNIYNVAPFVICPTTNTCPAQPTINNAINLTLKQQIQSQVIIAVQLEEEEEQTTKEKLLDAADWGYTKTLGIPNMYWVVIWLGIVATFIAVSRAMTYKGEQ